MRWEVTDESAVVSKSRPVKPGNGVEGKTGMTCGMSIGTRGGKSHPEDAKG